MICRLLPQRKCGANHIVSDHSNYRTRTIWISYRNESCHCVKFYSESATQRQGLNSLPFAQPRPPWHDRPLPLKWSVKQIFGHMNMNHWRPPRHNRRLPLIKAGLSQQTFTTEFLPLTTDLYHLCMIILWSILKNCYLFWHMNII